MMLGQFLCLTVILATVQATGELVILHSPSSVHFKGSKQVCQSTLKEICTAALGYTVKQESTWDGLAIINPFQLPKAVVGVAVEGVESLKSPRGTIYPLNMDEGEETTWQALSSRLTERSNDNTLVRMHLEDGVTALGQSALGELKPTAIDQSSLKALSLTIEEDRKFIEEVQLLRAIAKEATSAITADSTTDVYWFVVSGLQSVLDRHSANSAAYQEALTLLNNALNELCEGFRKPYDDKVVVFAFTNDATHIRNARSVSDSARVTNATETNNSKRLGTPNDANLVQNFTESQNQTKKVILKSTDIKASKDYTEVYPVMFNIFLWFGVFFVFSLIAVCIAIADMDPGRDSIIYRMTSNRMKKDN